MSSKSEASSRCAAANVDGESGGGVLGISGSSCWEVESWGGGVDEGLLAVVVGGLVVGLVVEVVVVGGGGGLLEEGAGGGGGLAWWEVR